MRDIASEQEGYISLEAKSPIAATVDDEEDDETDDIVLEDICEVVISLKCKQCQFLCNDKATLATHIKQVHSKRKLAVTNECSNRKVSREKARETKVLGHSTHDSSADQSPSSDGKDKSDFTEIPKKLNKRKKEHPIKIEDASSQVTTESSQSSSSISQEKSNGENDGSLPGDSSMDESVEDVFLCAECDIVFSSREMCCSHMHKVHGLKQFSADFIQEEIISKPSEETQSSKKGRKIKVPKQFNNEPGSVVPKKYRVSRDVFHTCSRCPIKFESVEVMKFHEQCHQSLSKIDKFSRQNAYKKKINDGINWNINVDEITTTHKGFICPVCESNGVVSQLFPKWGPCSWHLWKEHRIDCELYTCSVCKQFKSHLIARVKDHEQLHSTKASYKCKTCNKTFKQMKQLRCHEKYHKDNSTKLAPEVDSRWYTPKECPICQRILSDSKCLKKHISAVHNKLKPYVCNICGHTSARKAELQLHVRQHTGEKPYKCPMCPFQTGDHNSLRKHKLRHSDERPYACTYCDYRCIQSCAFKKHILACHPGQDVVFVCQLCSHASVNETLFTAHQKDHAEGRITVESQNELETSTPENRSSSPSISNTSLKNGTSVKYWSGDEDSLDIIDNGGVTIPASPQPPTPTRQDNTPTGESTIGKPTLKAVCEAKQTQNRTLSMETLNGAHKSIKSTTDIIPSNISFVVKTNHKDSMHAPQSAQSRKVAISLLQQDRHFLVPQGFCVTKLPDQTSSTPTLQSLSSPRPDKMSTLVASSSTNTSEDTESSSSEVITNPHQLIQNIQLTPLDLTDIISCNEQSNDDGMLQRLLDMSGV